MMALNTLDKLLIFVVVMAVGSLLIVALTAFLISLLLLAGWLSPFYFLYRLKRRKNHRMEENENKGETLTMNAGKVFTKVYDEYINFQKAK